MSSHLALESFKIALAVLEQQFIFLFLSLIWVWHRNRCFYFKHEMVYFCIPVHEIFLTLESKTLFSPLFLNLSFSSDRFGHLERLYAGRICSCSPVMQSVLVRSAFGAQWCCVLDLSTCWGVFVVVVHRDFCVLKT